MKNILELKDADIKDGGSGVFIYIFKKIKHVLYHFVLYGPMWNKFAP